MYRAYLAIVIKSEWFRDLSSLRSSTQQIVTYCACFSKYLPTPTERTGPRWSNPFHISVILTPEHTLWVTRETDITADEHILFAVGGGGYVGNFLQAVVIIRISGASDGGALVYSLDQQIRTHLKQVHSRACTTYRIIVFSQAHIRSANRFLGLAAIS